MATLDWVPASGRSAPPPLLCGEGVYWACDSVALAVGLHRVNLVVVGSVRRKAFHAHAEHRIGMCRVQPDVRFRGLAQVLGIRAVVYNPKVFGRAPRVVGCPRNNGQILSSQFELWSRDDAHARGFLGSRNELCRRWI